MPVYVNMYEELVGRVLHFAPGDNELHLGRRRIVFYTYACVHLYICIDR